ncbi:MAG TPA: hypothetical protein VK631_22015 [Solirubrobacteraceae bacterium]|nr:hypothetical protein [Solirubrobacteraceae bacterium]
MPSYRCCDLHCGDDPPTNTAYRKDAAAPSVDVEKLRAAADSFDAAAAIHQGASTGWASGEPERARDHYARADTFTACASTIRALLGDQVDRSSVNGPEEGALDYGPAETQYGVRWFGASDPAVITPTAADAMSIASEARHHSRVEAVTRQITSWRPVDGAPGEDSQT